MTARERTRKTVLRCAHVAAQSSINVACHECIESAILQAEADAKERAAKVCDDMERECAFSSRQDRESGYDGDAEHWEIKAGLAKSLAAAIRSAP